MGDSGPSYGRYAAIAGAAIGVIAGAAAGVLAERKVTARRRSEGMEDLGSLRGDLHTVVAADGLKLYAEVDEKPSHAASPRTSHRRSFSCTATRSISTAGTFNVWRSARPTEWCCSTSAHTVGRVDRGPTTPRLTSAAPIGRVRSARTSRSGDPRRVLDGRDDDWRWPPSIPSGSVNALPALP